MEKSVCFQSFLECVFNISVLCQFIHFIQCLLLQNCIQKHLRFCAFDRERSKEKLVFFNQICSFLEIKRFSSLTLSSKLAQGTILKKKKKKIFTAILHCKSSLKYHESIECIYCKIYISFGRAFTGHA